MIYNEYFAHTKGCSEARIIGNRLQSRKKGLLQSLLHFFPTLEGDLENKRVWMRWLRSGFGLFGLF